MHDLHIAVHLLALGMKPEAIAELRRHAQAREAAAQRRRFQTLDARTDRAAASGAAAAAWAGERAKQRRARARRR